MTLRSGGRILVVVAVILFATPSLRAQQSAPDQSPPAGAQGPDPIIEGIRTVLDEIALTDPSAKNAKPEQFVDSSFIAKLDKSGYIDRLYKQ